MSNSNNINHFFEMMTPLYSILSDIYLLDLFCFCVKFHIRTVCRMMIDLYIFFCCKTLCSNQSELSGTVSMHLRQKITIPILYYFEMIYLFYSHQNTYFWMFFWQFLRKLTFSFIFRHSNFFNLKK